MVQAPIFHVNGDDPEACVRVARLAFAFRQTFHKDVVIDMVCYRRHGHNEGDDPSYTQPLMYKRIDERRSVRKLYTEALVKRGDITLDEAEQALDDFQRRLQVALDETRQSRRRRPRRRRTPPAAARRAAPRRHRRRPRRRSTASSPALTTVPEGFTVHPKLAKQFETRDQDVRRRRGRLGAGRGPRPRLAAARGHRRAADRPGHPAGHVQPAPRRRSSTTTPARSTCRSRTLGADQAHSSGSTTRCCPSTPRSASSTATRWCNKDALVVWEAQFGDFVNGAQIIIDQFLVAAEDKWGQTSGLVLLLPHGYEGQGPEHSSARIERFLTLCAEDNIQVVQRHHAGAVLPPAAPQMRRDDPQAAHRVHAEVAAAGEASRLAGRRAHRRVVPGGARRPRRSADPAAVARVVFCSGKVAYDAIARRDEAGAPVAIVRVEQLYPWPVRAARPTSLAPLRRTPSEVVWLQEEPENMGPWRFMYDRSHEIENAGYKVRQVCRVESGSPATGSGVIHVQELNDLLDEAFAGL